MICEKSLEVAENKERETEKESQERSRGCKLLKTENHRSGTKRNRGHGAWSTEATEGHPRAIQIVVKRKELREKGFVRI